MAGSTRPDLQPLSPDETTMLLTAIFEAPVDPDAAQRLWKLARGNVLYLRNIVEQEVADGRLVQQHGSGDGSVIRSCRRVSSS